ncbi:MAG: hypothetical protein LUH16_05140 [Clostridiales bacterium]|nr:hypothetical protein [Clostridiales bacterium]
MDENEDAVYYTSGFSSQEELEAYEAELCATVEAEGAALLVNENNALPLSSGAKVSLFARGSVDLMYGGTGSVTWLSRSDWEGTYPTGTFSPSMDDELLAEPECTRYDADEVEQPEMPTLGADNGMTLSMMIGKDYDDADWDAMHRILYTVVNSNAMNGWESM